MWTHLTNNVAMLFTYLQHRTFDRFDPNGRTLAKQFFWFGVHEHVVVKIKRSTVQKQSESLAKHIENGFRYKASQMNAQTLERILT